MASTTTQYTQANRQMSLATPLGKDVLLLQNITYKEDFGRPFEMTLEMQSTDGEINFDKIISRNVTVTIQMPQDSPSEGGQPQRYLNGYVQEFRFVSRDRASGLYSYRAKVVPWISLLALTSGCQTFINQTIPQVIEQVFKDYNFADYTLGLTNAYQPLPFCVQYNETALDFVQRLMEGAGIAYYFIHSNGSHSLVLADGQANKISFPGYETIPYNPEQAMVVETIDTWSFKKSAAPETFTLSDYDYTSPNTLMEATSDVPDHQADSSFNWFSYPGYYTAQDERQMFANIRRGEALSQQVVGEGAGTLLGVSAGYSFTLDGFPVSSQNGPHLVTAATLTVRTPHYAAVETEGEDQFDCRTEFSTIPFYGTIFRPARITPRPRIDGYQTAIVVGPQGQEVTQPHTNPYGCIQVRFHWQLNGSPNTGTSVWVRVAHPSAGPGWGHMFTPRIGNEVVVAFEDGNPDRPLVVGSVYNAVNMPPLPLPSFSTHSYITDDGDNVFAMIPTQENQAIIISTPYNKTRKVWGSNPR
jgi:type VI secretion system secreted protein VgrG